MKNKKLISWLFISIGLLIIIGTHVFMLMKPMNPGWMQMAHAIINIISAISILVGIIIKSLK